MIEALIVNRLFIAFARLVQKVFLGLRRHDYLCRGFDREPKRWLQNDWQTFLGIFDFDRRP